MKIILDNIRSALNVGSVFRTSDAFNIQEILLCGITASPPSREVHKTALGAELTVAYRHFDQTTQAIAELKKKGYQIIAVEQAPGSVWLQDFHPSKEQKYAYVMGNEVDGVSSEVLAMCDAVVEIPQQGSKKSLNVSVAAGVVLWHVNSMNYNTL